MIFKNIFSPNVAEVINGEKLIPPNIIYLGAYTNMFLDIIGIVATCGFMLIVLVGIK
ncbi:hypothetical protein FACS189459_4550 [Bacilli bacterium]|nr:hypothetical protein FACS189459_4550 [Bacilli bacterium]